MSDARFGELQSASNKMRLARACATGVVVRLRQPNVIKEAIRMSMQETELESEFEQELHETEAGHEGEGILGSIGNVIGGLLGEGETESELELHELEGEGGLHELESEFESEVGGAHELEGEFESELEAGEHFLGGIGKFLRRAAPILRQVAKVAAPIVATAVGGPVGTALGGLASSLLESETEMELHELEGEGELHETETEFEGESELHESHESLHEMAHEIASHEMSSHEALAEMMAEQAAQEIHEGEAEAAAGAALVTVLSPRDRRALRRLLPHMVRGVAVLTRILRRRRATRPAVRAMPTIVRRTVTSLKRQAAQGRPITRRSAGRTMASQVRRVIGNPAVCGAAIRRNLRTARQMKRPRRFRPVSG
jgi:hypothetical protein